MLFSPESHEPLVSRAWDRDAALAAISEIAADCESAYQPTLYWPMPPMDEEDDGQFVTVVQGNGDWEKREVTTGPSSAGMVSSTGWMPSRRQRRSSRRKARSLRSEISKSRKHAWYCPKATWTPR